MNSIALQTQNLTRTFNALRAVDRLTLEVPVGSVFGFLGPNGAGKTTTIRLLLGLLEPTEGSAQVLGHDTRREAVAIRSRCGALLEHHGLYERLSAQDNLEYYARVWRLPANERRERVRAVLEQLGLWERRDELVGQWSRGMKQKLAVARTLLHRPALVFLDEPTAGLDPVAAAALRDDLARLVENEGVTVFLTTHNLSEAEKLCHQVGVIRQGQLVAVGAPADLRKRRGANRVEISGRFDESSIEQLRRQPQVSKVERKNGDLLIELAEGAESAPLIGLLVSAGGMVEEVRKNQASLEEVFLTLVEEEK